MSKKIGVFSRYDLVKVVQLGFKLDCISNINVPSQL